MPGTKFGRRELFVGASLLGLFGAGMTAQGATLVSDNFDNLASGANINGRTPTTTLNGATWITGTSTFLGNGSGGLSADSTKTQSAYVDIGTGYLSSNPGVYDLSLDITNPSGVAGSSWIGFGLAPDIATGGVNPGQNLATASAAPWLLFRVNGQEIVFQGPGNSGVAAYTSNSGVVSTGTAHTFRIQLDTTGANWTLNSYLDGNQLDLNAGSATSSTYTYATNPTTSHYVALSTGVNGAGGVGTVDNLVLTGPVPVPEPGTIGLLGAAGVGLLARRRRR
jgi:hypothetical protein